MTPTGTAEFARFRERVWADAALGDRLRSVAREEDLVAAAVREGQDAGFRFGETDVRAAMAEGRRQWIERWLV